ncbi:MAG: putative glycosyl transferase [Deltaproteobacteria bacterium]|nr:putative glycosyl transferase [Deltaproteobacteria bacterium]
MLLDIVTVTKDDLEGVANTIRSTGGLRMTDGVRQVIIDSSGEGIREKVKELACTEINVDYVWQAPSGIAPAFNKGLSLSRAEWVWFLNGGDKVHREVEPDKILYLLSESRADAIIFEYQLMDSEKRIKHPPMWSMWPPINSWIPHPATLTRRNLYAQYGNFNESLEIAMDYEFWMRSFAKEAVVDMISIPLTEYDTSGISSTQTAKTSREAVRVIRMHIWTLIKIWLKNGLTMFTAWYFFSKRSKK